MVCHFWHMADCIGQYSYVHAFLPPQGVSASLQLLHVDSKKGVDSFLSLHSFTSVACSYHAIQDVFCFYAAAVFLPSMSFPRSSISIA